MKTSSSFPDPRVLGRRASLLVLFLTMTVVGASAQSGGKPLSAFSNRQWGAEQGLEAGSIRSIAQTPDGYLWLGTDDALERFDGFEFKAIDLPNHQPIRKILTLVVDHDGALWIRCDPNRLIRYANGVFTTTLTPAQEVVITAVSPAQPNGLWLAGLSLGVVHITSTSRDRLSPPNSMTLAVAQTTDGRVWTGTRESGLYVLEQGKRQRIDANLPDNKINCLLADAANHLWIGTDGGLAFWDGNSIRQIPPPTPTQHLQIFALALDRDGSLWAGTSEGLMRFEPGANRWHQTNAGSQGSAVTSLLIDREDNIWFGSGDRLNRTKADRLQTVDLNLPTTSASGPGAVYVDARGRVWIAPLDGGLYWLEDGARHAVTVGGLDQDTVYSIDGSGSDLWLGRRKGGLTRLRRTPDGFDAKSWSKAKGLAEDSVYVVHVARDGTVWAGSLTSGLSRLTPDGRIETFNRQNGLRADSVTAIAESNDRTIWLGTPNGLRSWHQGRWGYVGNESGLPAPEIIALEADAANNLWIGTASGLAYMDATTGKIRAFNKPPSLGDPVYGLALQGSDSLLVATDKHILTVPVGAILRAQTSESLVYSYGEADGLTKTHGVRRSRSVVRDVTGEVWFTTDSGLSVLTARNRTPLSNPPPMIDGAVADDASLDIASGVSVPAGSRRLTLSYTAIQLRAAETLRFRYRLDAFDKDWSEVTPARKAIYTNLRPGNYKFFVQAGDSDGNWGGQQASINVAIAPYFWQRWQFQAVVLLLCAALVGWILRLRTQHLLNEANLRAEGRSVERIRIARELHDTLLQGFIGSLMHLNIASEELQANSDTRRKLERVMRIMEKVIEEGRMAVEGLRCRDHEFADIRHVFDKVLEELEEVSGSQHRIDVIGRPRTLHPSIVADITAIGAEAITNAMRHSHALLVTVQIRHQPSKFELLISDNGCGIEERTLQTGRSKHWGLTGMQERAKRISAAFTIESKKGTGTCVRVTLPASKAYAQRSTSRDIHIPPSTS